MAQETELICRAYITLRNGKRIYARQYGLKAFCFEASPKEPSGESQEEDAETEKADSEEEAASS